MFHLIKTSPWCVQHLVPNGGRLWAPVQKEQLWPHHWVPTLQDIFWIYFGWWICLFDNWHENAFLTIVMRILFWKQLAWWIYLEKVGQRAPVGANNWHEDMLHHLWVELVFIVVEGVPENMQKLSSKLGVPFSFSQFCTIVKYRTCRHPCHSHPSQRGLWENCRSCPCPSPRTSQLRSRHPANRILLFDASIACHRIYLDDENGVEVFWVLLDVIVGVLDTVR